MRSCIFACVAVASFAIVGLGANTADAGGHGVYYSGPGYYNAGCHNVYGGWGGGWGGWQNDHVWHDTGHYDYHPGGLVRHRNHYHYEPGHYDYHDTGHWDHLHW
jgi:hypothetical protein